MAVLSALTALWRYARHRCAPDDPPTAGQQQAIVDGIHGEVDILFDTHGVPHIRAGNEADLFFGLGYMHGRDRRFQMETLRALAYGELRALFGAGVLAPTLIEQEVLHRMLGFRRIAQRYLQDAVPEDRALLEAYSAGTNAASAREPLPFEFRLLGLQPVAWQPEDAIGVAQLLAFGLAKNWETELSRLEIALYQRAHGHDLQRAMSVWKAYCDFPPHLIERPDGAPAPELPPAIAPELAAYLDNFSHLYAGETAHEKHDAHVNADTLTNDTFVPRGGSNNWAIGGKWHAQGAGALASDPHLPVGLPSLGYLAHLECYGAGGYRVIGACHPGTLAIAYGSNGKVAWGVTANWADVTDLYVEQPVAHDPQRYRHGGTDLPFESVRETFLIRRDGGNGYEEEVREARRTRHGLILNGLLARIPPGFPLLALRRDEAPGNPVGALRALYRAGDAGAAATALSRLDILVGHWALADRSGNIAYQSSGRVPVRSRHRGSFPVPGWCPEYEWNGWLVEAGLPHCVNPQCGFIATANNQVIAPDACDFAISDEGDTGFRAARASACLSRLAPACSPLAIGRSLHTDCLEPGFAVLLPIWRCALTALLQDGDRDIAEAADILLGWNGECRPDSTAASVYQAFCVQLLRTNLRGEIPASTCAFIGRYMTAEPLVISVLSDRTMPGWNSDASIAASLRAAVAALRARYGGKPRDWQWKRIAPFVLKHPLGGHPLLSRYLNRGPLPTSGSHNSLNKQYTSRTSVDSFPVVVAAALRLNIDLADMAHSTMCVAGGQSGRPGSVHYDDQLKLYLDGAGISMEMDFSVIRQSAAGSLILSPRATG